MADSTWTGATSGDINVAGNWVGGVPGNADRAFFPAAGVTNAPNASMAALVDTVTLIHYGRGATYNIGASGNALKVSATDIVVLGSGAFWYDGDVASTNILCDMDPGGTANITGPITNVRILRGTITLAAGLGATTVLEVGYHSLRPSDVNVTVVAGAGTTSSYRQWGGTVTASHAMTNVRLFSGTLNKDTTVTTMLLEQYGGRFNWRSSGTMTTATIYGGVFDSEGFGAAHTLTNGFWYPGAKVIRDPDLLTVTNEADYREES